MNKKLVNALLVAGLLFIWITIVYQVDELAKPDSKEIMFTSELSVLKISKETNLDSLLSINRFQFYQPPVPKTQTKPLPTRQVGIENMPTFQLIGTTNISGQSVTTLQLPNGDYCDFIVNELIQDGWSVSTIYPDSVQIKHQTGSLFVLRTNRGLSQ